MLRFDARTGTALARPRRIASADVLADVLTFSPDGRRLVTAEQRSDDPAVLNRLLPAEDRAIVVRDARTLRVLRSVPGGEFGGELRGPEYNPFGVPHKFALSPAADTLAVGRFDGSVHLVDLRTGAIRTAFGRHTAPVSGTRFTSDGRFLMTVGEDGKAIVWDVDAGAAGETFAGHVGPVLALAVDRRSGTLYTGGHDGSVIAWDLVGDRRLGRPFDAGPGSDVLFPPATSISRNGRLLATTQRGPDWRGAPGARREGHVTVVDTRTMAPRDLTIRGVPLDGQGSFAPAFPAFGPRGTLVVSGPGGFLALADARTGEVLHRLRGHRDLVSPPAVSADGRIIATTSADRTLRVWDARSARPLGDPIPLDLELGDGATASVALSPDGRLVAAAREKEAFVLSEIGSRRRLARLRVDHSLPTTLSFSRDGRLLLGGSADGRVRVFSVADRRPIGPAFPAHAGPVMSVDASPDGRTLLTTGTDGRLRLWDLASRRPIGRPLPGPEDVPAIATFAPDGDRILAVYANGRGYRWDVRPSAWMDHACQVAGRRLTRKEWRDVLADRPYQPAC